MSDLTDGLRALTTMIENNPDLEPLFGYTFGRMLVPLATAKDLAAAARAGLTAKATVSKEFDDSYAAINLAFSPSVSLRVYGSREAVCERIVTGTRTVTKTIPDPTVTVPTVEVTAEVETVEWVCGPLLGVK